MRKYGKYFDDEEFDRLRAEGMTYKKIGKIFQVSEMIVMKYRKERGLI